MIRRGSWAIAKKQCRTPNVSVGTVKKSIAAITSRWLFRKAAQRFADTALLGTVLEEIRLDVSIPSLATTIMCVGVQHDGFTIAPSGQPVEMVGRRFLRTDSQHNAAAVEQPRVESGYDEEVILLNRTR
jgi:hypothetical protein